MDKNYLLILVLGLVIGFAVGLSSDFNRDSDIPINNLANNDQVETTSYDDAEYLYQMYLFGQAKSIYLSDTVEALDNIKEPLYAFDPMHSVCDDFAKALRPIKEELKTLTISPHYQEVRPYMIGIISSYILSSEHCMKSNHILDHDYWKYNDHLADARWLEQEVVIRILRDDLDERLIA